MEMSINPFAPDVKGLYVNCLTGKMGYVMIPHMSTKTKRPTNTIGTSEVEMIFKCSRSTAYNIMRGTGQDQKVIGRRKLLVVPIPAVTDSIDRREAELREMLRIEVLEPRQRLLALIGDGEEVEEKRPQANGPSPEEAR